MKVLTTLTIALALVGCSDDDSLPMVHEPDAGTSVCDNPAGTWYATIVWGQGTCTVTEPTAVLALSIAKAASGYTVRSSQGDGTMKAERVDGACQLSVELSQASSGAAWTMHVRPDTRNTGDVGGGLFAVMTPSGDCIHAFTVTNYEAR